MHVIISVVFPNFLLVLRHVFMHILLTSLTFVLCCDHFSSYRHNFFLFRCARRSSPGSTVTCARSCSSMASSKMHSQTPCKSSCFRMSVVV